MHNFTFAREKVAQNVWATSAIIKKLPKVFGDKRPIWSPCFQDTLKRSNCIWADEEFERGCKNTFIFVLIKMQAISTLLLNS
jgi:hypothetical protein